MYLQYILIKKLKIVLYIIFLKIIKIYKNI